MSTFKECIKRGRKEREIPLRRLIEPLKETN